MDLLAKIDEMGKLAWITLMVLSFILFWPAGLALLAFLIGSGRMGCRGYRRGWRRDDETRSAGRGWWEGRGGGLGVGQSTGNRAFDEYREETLRRLEEERKDFGEFLDRLRHARDKAEFDEFLASRRNRGSDAPSPA